MKKDIIIIFAVIILVIVLISDVNIQSVDDYYQTHLEDIKEDSKTITLTISCTTILNNYEKLDNALKNEKYVPKDGIILKKTQYVLRPKDTVYDILCRATKSKKIQMETTFNKFNTAYVQGINHLYEFSCGANSGWTFRVNGKFPNYGCANYQLKDKDNIEWLYTCDNGRDVDLDWSKNND